MRWENIQRTLRYKLGELFSQEEAIRALVRDVDSTLESLIVWKGNAVDCWSGILREVRVRHLELDLIEAAELAYPQDAGLRKAKDDFNILTLEETSAVTSTTASPPPSVAQEPRSSSPPQGRKQADGTGPIEVFISYSEEDERFKKQLETHLALLKREKIISPWYSQQTQLGLIQGWEQEIAEHIDSAQIVLLLMSPSFIASDQLYENEMTRAIERQKAGDPVRVIPIAVRHIAPSDPDKTPDFQKIQGLPRNGKPIDAWHRADEAWAQIAQEIRLVCKDLRGSTGKS